MVNTLTQNTKNHLEVGNIIESCCHILRNRDNISIDLAKNK